MAFLMFVLTREMGGILLEEEIFEMNITIHILIGTSLF